LVRLALLLAVLAGPAQAERIDPARLVPVVRDAALDGYRGVDLADRPVVPGLSAYLATEDGAEVQYLLAEDVALTGLTADQAWARAVANRIGRGVPRLVEVAPGVMSLEQDALNESSHLLDHARWRQVAAGMGRLVAAVPNRHVLIFGDGDAPGVVAAMDGIADYARRTLDDPLSTDLIEWTGDGWAPLAR
jgi:hypothetical protein